MVCQGGVEKDARGRGQGARRREEGAEVGDDESTWTQRVERKVVLGERPGRTTSLLMV